MTSNTTKPVAIVVGASRGIGRHVAIELARNGYAVAVAAKTRSDAAACAPFPPDPNSPASTIDTVAREIRELHGGDALPVQVDVREHEDVRRMVRAVARRYGRVDVVVYNSGAIWWSSVARTPVARFRLLQRVNVEGLYAVVQEALPWLYADHGHDHDHGGEGQGEGRGQGEHGGGRGRIVVVSPPVYSRFLRGKTAYAMGKWGMSALTMGLAVDFEREGRSGMAITSLWPAVAIESAATRGNRAASNDDDDDGRRNLRSPAIFSDAILSILRAPAGEVNGKTLLDEDYLREHDGVADFSRYALVPGTTPRRIMPRELPDLTVAEQDDEGVRVDSTVLRTRGKL